MEDTEDAGSICNDRKRKAPSPTGSSNSSSAPSPASDTAVDEPDPKSMRLDVDDDNQEEEGQGDNERSDYEEDEEDDYDSSEIDDMLEKTFKVGSDKAANGTAIPHEERKKIVLRKRDHDYFDVLPEGWLEVTHFSGMPVYLHKQTRVCCMSKPYHLGPGSARKHDIPISAIPCFQYRKELEKEKSREAELIVTESNEPNSVFKRETTSEIEAIGVCEVNADSCVNGYIATVTSGSGTGTLPSELATGCEPHTNGHATANGEPISSDMDVVVTNTSAILSASSHPEKCVGIPFNCHSISAKVESVKDNKINSLSFQSIREYCQKLFEFQEITIRKFKTWSDRRKHMQARKLKQRPSLVSFFELECAKLICLLIKPEGTKLITCPLPKSSDIGDAGRSNRKEFVMNPAGKSSVCILHEFVQHAERVQPQYRFKELENASQPYSATVIIKGMEYGEGFGSSKKQAKAEAARVSLELLIPQIKEIVPDSNNKQPADPLLQDLNYFDDIEITDSRVSDLSSTAGQYTPYQILVECLRRNFGMGDTEIKCSVKLLKHQKNEFTMDVGTKHSVTIICRNKREGKQLAAQAILEKLHPQIKFWGPLLRLYGRGSCKTPKEKKEEELKITELQSTACANKPNHAILSKLKEEMEKLQETKEKKRLIDSSASVGGGETNRGQEAVPDSNLKHINL